MSDIVYVFIDASNLWQAQKAKGKMFDYQKLKIFLKEKFNASEIKIFYYTSHLFAKSQQKGLYFFVQK